jgi:site-specific recombinase XerC
MGGTAFATTPCCMYRHALRVTEAVTMRLDQVNLKQARIWVKRSKNSLDTE